MPEREASGDFDYLFEDIPDQSSVDALPEQDTRAAGLDHLDVVDAGPSQVAEPHFDAFDSSTWYFEPAPPPWYRTKQTLTVFVVAAVAAVALVVSGVLLVFRGPATTAVDETISATQTAATTAAPAPVSPPRTSALPPPPPPPAETSAAAPAAPAAPTRQRTPTTRSTKEPEIGVTRTPVTRSPISVAPQPRTGQR